MTLQLNLHPGLWHDLIIYELHSNFKMDNGWMVIWSQRAWHMVKDLTPQCAGEELKFSHLQPKLPWLLSWPN
jgi:uncharacterized membrane protein YcfT